MLPGTVRLLLVLASALLVGCEAASPTLAPAAEERAASAPPAPRRPQWLRGPSDGAALAPFLARARAQAAADGYRLVVYVGAPWCEPCQVFHQALVAGELDRELSGVRFVEFDLDRDAEPLRAAGYAAPMIPLFALPEASGRASALKIFGSIKGPGAAAEITPRLLGLLAQASS